MSRFAKKLGAQQMRYQFDVILHQVCMNIPYEVVVQVVWKKGKSKYCTKLNFNLSPLFKNIDQKRLESKSSPSLGANGSTACNFDGEIMSMISSVMKDKKDGKFTEKTSTLVIKIIKGDKSRSVG